MDAALRAPITTPSFPTTPVIAAPLPAAGACWVSEREREKSSAAMGFVSGFYWLENLLLAVVSPLLQRRRHKRPLPAIQPAATAFVSTGLCLLEFEFLKPAGFASSELKRVLS
jgi:hypothetical protein